MVNADFTAKDSIPTCGSLNTRGNFKVDGADDKDIDDYRATLGLEYWEPFMDNDRISASVTADPAEVSELLSLSLQYKFGPRKTFSGCVWWILLSSEPSAGDINSGQAAKYDINNQFDSPTAISALESMGYSGEGYFGGYQGSIPLKTYFWRI